MSRAVCRLGETCFEKLGGTPPHHRIISWRLLEAVEAAIIGRGVVDRHAGSVGMGLDSAPPTGARCDSPPISLDYQRLLLATSLPKVGFVTLHIVGSTIGTRTPKMRIPKNRSFAGPDNNRNLRFS